MLEFLIALLVFSTGILGLLSAQLVGKRAGYEAIQRSVATVLARDILERMRANPGQSLDYRVNAAGNASNRLPAPSADCHSVECSAAQLAAFDLWQWESWLLGESERDTGFNAGGLVSPRACITSDDGVVEVAISWLGLKPPSEPMDSLCGSEQDEINTAGDQEDDESQRRNQLTISTYIVDRR